MMKLNNRYFLLRHGQTIYQTRKKKFIYPDPRIKVPLTKKGIKQVEESARKLKNKRIKAIYSSIFLRTRQTAIIVAKKLGLKIHFDARLRDLGMGIYYGRKKEEFYRVFSKNMPKRFFRKPEKGESWQDVRKRLRRFIKDIDKKYKNENILIVSHGDPLWLLKGMVRGISDKKLLKSRKKLFHKNGEVKILNS